MGYRNPFSYFIRLCLSIILFVCSIQTFSQSNFDSLTNKINPQKWSALINNKMSRIESRLIAKSEKTLNRLNGLCCKSERSSNENNDSISSSVNELRPASCSANAK
jgi:hypothetical protein